MTFFSNKKHLIDAIAFVAVYHVYAAFIETKILLCFFLQSNNLIDTIAFDHLEPKSASPCDIGGHGGGYSLTRENSRYNKSPTPCPVMPCDMRVT